MRRQSQHRVALWIGVVIATVLMAGSTVGCTRTFSSPLAGGGRAPVDPKPIVPNPGRASLILGPVGVGQLRLGMTRLEVERTRTATTALGSRHDGWPTGCSLMFYRADKLGRVPGDTTNGTVSARQGVERISATDRMVTPEGVRIGSSLATVRAAYDRPHLRAGDEFFVRASALAVYRIQLTRVVASISLELRHLSCTR